MLLTLYGFVEYFTVFSGATGEALATADYIPSRYPTDAWGGWGGNGGDDNNGNRVDRFLACAAYLDGKLPSAVMCRGYYGRSVLEAWDYRNGKLTSRWVFDSKNRENPFSGQGNHNLSVADVDNDGMSDDLEEYIRNNYCTDPSVDSSNKFSWDTIVNYHGLLITAGEAYRRELAMGVVETKDGVEERPELKQVADTTGSRIPDWWEDLYNIVGVPGTTDSDNDGLNNRNEYLVSEVCTNFNIRLNPVMPLTDGRTNDYFRTVGNLYLGEMVADFDQMEDHWERKIADLDYVDANVWDALKDADEDGWTNFDENRYNGYAMSTLPKLVSHAVGDAEVLDAPTPTLKLTVRYNGGSSLTGGEGKKADAADGGSNDGSSDINIGNAEVAALVVKTFTDGKMDEADAIYNMKPGSVVTRAVYLGGWENRIVRGTMGPGHIDIGSVNIKFAQVPQSDLYSWTDESGLHLAKSYKEGGPREESEHRAECPEVRLARAGSVRRRRAGCDRCP